jgi:serine/threonine-protein kinase
VIDLDARALRLFEAALDQPAERRVDHIREAAAGDAALADAALALLGAHSGSGSRFEPDPQRGTPQSLGGWRIVRRLGAGGMGEVFEAVREGQGFRQHAAIKRLTSGLGGTAAIQRFEAERRFLASLEHPGIARIIDGGSEADGRPWVAMEYVDGEPIDRWCRARGFDVRARVRLFLDVIEAVDHAHRALILHRDLKPSNVLVTVDGQVKLLDFGIAKSLDDPAPGLTATSIGPLTPEYASPEQLDGRPLTIASDVYALGLLLFQLLTGRLPVEDPGRALSASERRRLTETPSRPSIVLDAAALALPDAERRRWMKQIDGDLDRVLLKALAVDVERRYPSARALGEDLERWLADRPVAARAGDRLYRARLFVRRNRIAVAAASAAVAALAVGLAVAAHQARVATAAAARAESSNAFLLELLTRANPVASGREPSLIEAIGQAVERIPAHFEGQPDSEADIRHAIGLAYTNLMRLDEADAQFTRALALRREGSPEHAEVLQARALLSWTRGRTDQAEADYRMALAVYSADPASAQKAGEVENDLAALMSDLGRYEQAIVHAEASVASARALHLPPGVLGPRLENLGSALQGAGRLDESERTYREAITALEQALPERTVALAVALNNFALVYRDMSRPSDALEMFERAIAVREGAFGPDNPDLVGPLINAARIRADQGDMAGARRDAERALALVEKAFAPDYVGRGHVHLGAAQVALAAGDRAATIRHAEVALEVFGRADAADPAWSERATDLIARARSGSPSR